MSEDLFDESINQSVKHMKRLRKSGLCLRILSALEGSPKNSEELINRVDLISGGFWRPSTESVNQLLDTLTKEGCIRERDDGRYELTEQGHKELEWPLGLNVGFFAPERQKTMEMMVSEAESNLTFLEDLKAINRARVNVAAERLRTIRDRVGKY